MRTFLTATILCGGVLLAADFWQTKKPSEWTEKEARKLIEGSPWVKETTPKMTDAGMSSRGEGGGGRGGGGRGGGGGGGGMGAGGGGMGAGGGGGPMSGPAGGQMPQVRVTFETAMPVAEAKGRIEIQDGFKGVREEYVVISVSGMRMMGGMGSRGGGAQGKSKSEPPTPESRKEQQEEMQARLLQLTTLKVKDDKVFQPAEARIQQTVNGQVMLFAFPRKELDLKPDDKSITFKTTMGPVEISVKFSLKEMMYQEKLAL